MNGYTGAPRIRRIVILGGLVLALLAGYRATFAEPEQTGEETAAQVDNVTEQPTNAPADEHPVPPPTSLHLLATGLLLVPAAHKLRLIPR